MFKFISSLLTFTLSSNGTVTLCVISLLAAILWLAFGPDTRPLINKQIQELSSKEAMIEKKPINVSENNTTTTSSHKPSTFKSVNIATATVKTDYGNIHVTIEGNPSDSAYNIVTYHDVCCNHRICFNNFFSLARNRSDLVFDQFCVYHIDAPGHHDEDDEINTKSPYPSMTELAKQVHVVITELNIKLPVLLGVGAGANICMRYALLHPLEPKALIVISMDPMKSDIYEFYLTSYILTQIKHRDRIFSRETIFGNLSGHLFSNLAAQETLESYKESVRVLHLDNVALFLNRYQRRPAIDVTSLRTIKHVPTLLISSSSKNHGLTYVPLPSRGAAQLEENAREMLTHLSSNLQSTVLHVGHSGPIVTEESPRELLQAISLFLEGVGYRTSLK